MIFVLGTTVDPFLTCLEQGACYVAVSYSALVILILFVACLAAPWELNVIESRFNCNSKLGAC